MNKKLIISKLFNNSFLKKLKLQQLNKSNPILKIISFHRVIPDDLDPKDYRYLAGYPRKKDFEKLVKHISLNYNLICLKKFAKEGEAILKKDKLNIAITFDDGYKDSLTNAFPILKKYQVPATIFCTINSLDGEKLWFQEIYQKVEQLQGPSIKLSWIDQPINLSNKWKAMERIANSCKDLKYEEALSRIALIPNYSEDLLKEEMLTWDDLIKFKQSALISIGAHTCKHWNLTTLNKHELHTELNTPLQKLRDFLDEEGVMVAYPNGRYNENILKKAEQLGYTMGFIMSRGINNQSVSKYAFYREYIDTDLSLFDFQLHGFDELIHQLFNRSEQK